jgi:hypothetical protein
MARICAVRVPFTGVVVALAGAFEALAGRCAATLPDQFRVEQGHAVRSLSLNQAGAAVWNSSRAG